VSMIGRGWKRRLLWGISTVLLLLGGAAAPISSVPAEDPASKEAETVLGCGEVKDLIEAGKYAVAEALARELLERVEKEYGESSLEAASVLDALVEALAGRGKVKDPESRALAERVVAIKEKALGPGSVELAKSLGNLAGLLEAAADYAPARLLRERALAIYEKALGPDHPDVAVCLTDLALLLESMGVYAGARALHERALVIQEGVSGRDSVAVARTSDYLANVLREMGEWEKARSLYERALEIGEKALGPDDPNLASTLNNFANLLTRVGDYEDARRLYERALANKEKAFGPEHLDVARILHNLGIVVKKTGDYKGAMALYERALAIREKRLGPEHPDVASSLNSLANVLRTMGDYARARPLYERALAIDENARGPWHPRVALSLNNLGRLLRTTGDVAGARLLLERSLEIRERVLGPEHPDVATSLHALAGVHMETGDYAGAKPLYERVLAIREKALGPEHRYVASTLNNLAGLLKRAGDYSAAKTLYLRAHAIKEKALGPEHDSVAFSLNNLANLLRATDDHAEARPLYERALAIREKTLGPEHALVASTLSNLATSLRATGDDSGARRLYERALTIREKALGPRHPRVAESGTDLAVLFFETGQVSRALEYALRAEGVAREHLRLTSRTLPERQALRYAAVRAGGLDVALSIAAEDVKKIPAAGRRIWDALIRSRALVLDEIAARRHTVAEARQIVRIAERFASVSQRLANMMVRGPGREPPERYRRLLDEARREREEAEQALADRSVSFREEKARAQLGFEEVAGSLPEGSALVAYALYDRHAPDGRKKNVALPGQEEEGTSEGDRSIRGPAERLPSYIGFVLRVGEGVPSVVPLGPAEEIDLLVSRWKEEAGRGWNVSGRAASDVEAAYRSVGEALRRKIWDPFATLQVGVKEVFVVPDGALHLVSLAALPVGQDEYLVERGPRVHYLSAERDLVPSGMRELRGEGLLALGDPAFDETALFAALAPPAEEIEEGVQSKVAALFPFRGMRPACADFRSLDFAPVPATAWETREVVDLWKKQAAAWTATAKVFHLSGSGASEDAFKERASGRRVLHLATHGFFLGGRCESALRSTRGISGQVSDSDRQLPVMAGENPLLLAGLALAGANHRSAAGPQEEDGILTAEEIASLDLSGVEWAVLSACETGVGEIKAGEGVFGLRRAFQVAGVDTLIMSLWSVEDEATREWMRNLYEARFTEGRDTAVSVREASLRVLKRRREDGESTHPFYWAAFVAAGDWR